MSCFIKNPKNPRKRLAMSRHIPCVTEKIPTRTGGAKAVAIGVGTGRTVGVRTHSKFSKVNAWDSDKVQVLVQVQ